MINHSININHINNVISMIDRKIVTNLINHPINHMVFIL